MKPLFFKSSLILLALTVALSCRQSKDVLPSADFAPYISAFTGGIVKKDASVIIEFTEDVSPETQENVLDKKLFSFSPSLKGAMHWINATTLEFVPEEGALKQGVTYNASFALDKLLKVEKKLSQFNFSFTIEESDFKIVTNRMEIKPNESVTIAADLTLTDVIPLETAQKMVSAKIDGKPVDITFESTEAGNSFHFTVNEILREEKDKELIISIDGDPAQIKRKENLSVQIPARDVFKLLDYKVVSSPDLSLQLTFSDILSETQDLKGLITLKNVPEFTSEVQSNLITIHFTRPSNTSNLEVSIDRGLKNNRNETLGETQTVMASLEQLNPAVELLSTGVIIPDTGTVIVPFRAIALKAVDLKIIRVFESNILMFLQDNSMKSDASYQLRRAGRLVYKQTLKLDKSSQNWENYSLDLTGIIRQRPGDIYRIELSFIQDYAIYDCNENSAGENTLTNAVSLTQLDDNKDVSEDDDYYWDTPDNYYYEGYDRNMDWSVYDWYQKDNPCDPTYYMASGRSAATNVFVSNIGLIAKMNADNTLWVSAADLRDTKPVANAEIVAYNYQLQPLSSAKTDPSGFAVLSLKSKPFAIMASSGNQKAYLRLVDGEQNLLSRFDVGGTSTSKGLKGYVYGERGVWRPGDTLHIAFMLEDKLNKIPDNHPVTMEVFNPRGQFYKKMITVNGLNGLYTFKLATKPDDPTGVWNAYIKVGGATFYKSLRIEAVKPNRLKIKLDLPKIIDKSKETLPLGIESSWLTGANAGGLDAKVDVTLSETYTAFEGYEEYEFDNPVTKFTSNNYEIYNGKLDDSGKASVNVKVPDAENAPGMLTANFICRVFEPGGDASIYSQSLPFSPFPSYVGVNFNLKDGEYYLFTDEDHDFDVVTLSPEGKPVNRNGLEYSIYRIGWSWWWEYRSEDFSSYINNSYYKPVSSGTLNTVNGKAKIKFRINYPDWGRYFVFIKDPASGHATGGTVLIDYPEWRGRSNKQDPDGVKMLTFSTDKDNYEAGEEATVTIPAVAAGGTALVAIENGVEVLSREWVQLNAGQDTKYTLKITEKMSPNVYIHISLLQPHKAATDLPIRLYGIRPVFVSNKQTVLNPVITMDDVLRPDTKFKVKIKEKSGKPMTYTLAIVDDGLLDLTNFSTPDPWNYFYAREALGIRTWDLYDNVMGAFTGRLGSLFSIGGDGELQNSPAKANRFRPVVLYTEPVSLKPGEEKTHNLEMPAYVGSVRVMVVACQDGAYGNASKTAPVRSPLMTLSSLPRVLSTGERIELPVNVFMMEEGSKTATVKIETANGLLKTVESNSKSVTLPSQGDELVYFPMVTGNKTGSEKVTITSTSGSHTFKETVEIEIRNPNPPVMTYQNKLLAKGESVEYEYTLDKEYDGNKVTVEMSRIPSINLARRFDFLYNYYHLCTEQLVSCALPLLYMSDFKDVGSDEKHIINTNINNAISHIYTRQLADGGFSLWPGQTTYDWVTSYAGHFLAVAKERGYEVSGTVMSKWTNYQRKIASSWQYTEKNSAYDYLQAYRLYTLALSGSPDLGAMNRLKEIKNLTLQERWRLAAAYALCGKKDAANELVFNAEKTVSPYGVNYMTFGSSNRDDAMIIETLLLLDKDEEAFIQAQKLAANLSQETYYGTQSTAYAIVAMGELASKFSDKLDFQYFVNDKPEKVSVTGKALYQKDLPLNPSSGKVKIVNNQDGYLYTSLFTRSKPLIDNTPSENKNLQLDVVYKDMNGNVINVEQIKQGSDFECIIKVSNISGRTNYENIALTYILPSGWEVVNRDMYVNPEGNTAGKLYDYKDVRDDRVLLYFGLPTSKTKEFTVTLQSSYIGNFVLPAVFCEAMYDPASFARTQAGKVSVVK
ncbi:MAG: alpha-2-macroglobulin [Tannerella sp.]|jgi:uncharacterized protein YfaS (alpha-2-macroglobulin family)|nr:alpha-2-macroglobulin [Tannerella sp.]